MSQGQGGRRARHRFSFAVWTTTACSTAELASRPATAAGRSWRRRRRRPTRRRPAPPLRLQHTPPAYASTAPPAYASTVPPAYASSLRLQHTPPAYASSLRLHAPPARRLLPLVVIYCRRCSQATSAGRAPPPLRCCARCHGRAPCAKSFWRRHRWRRTKRRSWTDHRHARRASLARRKRPQGRTPRRGSRRCAHKGFTRFIGCVSSPQGIHRIHRVCIEPARDSQDSQGVYRAHKGFTGFIGGAVA